MELQQNIVLSVFCRADFTIKACPCPAHHLQTVFKKNKNFVIRKKQLQTKERNFDPTIDYICMEKVHLISC